jgi:4-amino-4-deoxy-L-arabinose transferase-like glycosyltransferase
MNGLPFIQKPPLYFWLEAAAIGTVGANPFTARLVSLASSVLICVSVFWLVRQFVDERSARWSLAALVFNPLYFGGAQYANFDMLIAGLVTATLALAVSATQSTTRARMLWLSAYATAGLAVLAKADRNRASRDGVCRMGSCFPSPRLACESPITARVASLCHHSPALVLFR